MPNPVTPCGRRRFVTLTATGLAAAPWISALISTDARAADLVSESDPKAVALKYRADAAKSPERKDPQAYCDNCNLYHAQSGAAAGACELLDNRLVAAKGWCASWEGS